jgi:photosystem II stability/assembly factor-like uncharacterized protein
MLRCFALCTLLAQFCLAPSAMAREAEHRFAPIMPRASQSLLLDVTNTGSRLVAVGERGHILFSDDNGQSWQQARVPSVQMLTSVFFANNRHGWAAGHDGIVLVTDDGGESWRTQRDGIAAQQQINLELRESAHQDIERLEQALSAATAEQAKELEIALEDAELDLEDADLALAEPPFASPLMDIWFQDRQQGWAVGAFGTLLVTRNGGRSWDSAPDMLNNPEELHLNAVSGDGRGRVFIAGESGIMFRSLDGGVQWERLESPYDGSWFGGLYSAAEDALLVFGLQGQLYRSGDFGQTWSSPGGAIDVTLAGGSSGPGREFLIVGASGTVLQSADGGRTFSQKNLPQRLSLSGGVRAGDSLVLVGQGGIRILGPGEWND